ncbi:oxygen tolerance domain protein [Pantoea sp. S18]|uniref:oxygen tolerance domain protein n=1 Tax=Pantoea sp. S18 TaxID=3019892 RepID=UPI002B2009FB|nr:oxygen tolerance domain protein [Pantoea sp. S18]MEA5101385.1 oxygen tolerance domain protein [Pantoea sp. S18]
MKRLLLCLLLLLSLPVRAEMTMTRELIAPEQLVPGQPITIAVTFWTDSWFNPPPQWPEMVIENGNLLNTPLPNQLVTRISDGISWSGIRMERQVMAWDQGTLRFPAADVVMRSANQPPKTVSLPTLQKSVNWPADVRQPDRFLPASTLELSQQWQLYRATEDKQLHVGDVIERVVTLRATDVITVQIPQLLYAIPGSGAQRLPPINSNLTQGRDEIVGAQREERLRYLPSQSGELVIPPLRLRWWDTRQHQWQLAELPGAHYTIAAARPAGSEKTLKARAPTHWKPLLAGSAMVLALLLLGFFFRRTLSYSLQRLLHRTREYWRIVPLPDLIPTKRKR